MKAILVTSDGQLDLIDKDWTYNEISEAVGGLIEAVSFGPDNDFFAYINEEGKIIGLPENVIATSFWYDSGARVMLGDRIAGNAVFFGGIDENGDNLPIESSLWISLVRYQEILGYTQIDEDSDDDFDEGIPCSMCDGEMIQLGQLGRMIAYSCRYCGWESLEQIK